MINKNVREYLSKIDKEYVGEIEDADISINGSVCDITGDWKDVISVYLICREGRIEKIKGKCGPCDPYAYVALNILCKTLAKMECSQIISKKLEIEKGFADELGGEIDSEMRFHFERIIGLIEEKIKE